LFSIIPRLSTSTHTYTIVLENSSFEARYAVSNSVFDLKTIISQSFLSTKRNRRLRRTTSYVLL